ncbi:MAG: hypothetical protein Q7W45_14610 [Bacteroidota bacterium]|nr:hypothetical protein [Bacteroidota bacterium]MDP3147401.1 hypothetical protein [Bacteroidota bacterium]
MASVYNRQNALKINDQELDTVLKIVEDTFEKNWLCEKKDNPLQKLWERRDSLSTNELFSLGICLQRLNGIDSNWVKKQVKIIKTGPSNNRIGAFFEVFGLGFLGSESRIIPSKENQPGYDGILNLDAGKSMRISLKNYGISAHQKDFIKNSEQIELLIKQLLSKHNLPPLQVLIESPENYPVQKDWNNLKKYLPTLFERFKKNKEDRTMIIDRSWVILLPDLGNRGQAFHKIQKSYTLIITSKYHKNEENNLFDKLNDACHNLTKHSNIETKDIINFVFIHLPTSASIKNCTTWVENYFRDYPNKPISGVILYQPCVASDFLNQKTFISHCFSIKIKADKFLEWNNNLKQIDFGIPVGIIANEPATLKLIVDDSMSVSIDDRYIYQRGNHYLTAVKGTDGSLGGNITKVSSGIFTHLAIKPFEDQQEVIISGRFEPEDELMIL